MKFLIKSETLLSRTAKRLREIIPMYASAQIPESFNFKDATAYTFGYDSLRALRANVKQASEAEERWDEECTLPELTARRLAEANRLDEYAVSHGIQLENVKELIERWQPSAARPQAPALTKDMLAELRAAGVPLQAFCLLLAYEITRDDPTQEDLELFHQAIKSSEGLTKQVIPLYIGPLAVRLVNRGTTPGAKLGIALLEMLCETSFIYPKVNLARALRNGWGVAPNLERAKSLCECVSKALDAGDDVFTHKDSWIDFYTLRGQLYSDSTLQEERKLAFESYKKAADFGSGPAALFLAHYHLPLKPGMAPDCFSGVVPPDPAASLRYFQDAMMRGYDPVAKAFPDSVI